MTARELRTLSILLPFMLIGTDARAAAPAGAGDEHVRFTRSIFTTGIQNTGAFLQDRDGFIWIGTFGGGLVRFDGYETRVYKPGGENPFPDLLINALYEDKDGLIWAQTGSSGLVQYDKRTDSFTRFMSDPSDPHSLSSNASTLFAMSTMGETADGLLWIGTQEGLNSYDRKTRTFTRYLHDSSDSKSLSYDDIHAVLVDRFDRLWVATNGGGLDRLERNSGIFTHFTNDPRDPTSLASNVVYALLEDKDGALWVGTNAGLQKLDQASGRFIRYPLAGAHALQASDMVISLSQDRKGTIWISFLKSAPGGMAALDPRTGAVRRFSSRPQDAGGPSTDFIRSVIEDRSGILWIVNSVGTIDTIDPNASRFTTFMPPEFPAPFVSSLYLDRKGNLWISTFPTGLTRRDGKSGAFVRYFSDHNYSCLYEDGSGSFWMATTLPATLHRFDPRTGRIVQSWANDPSRSSSLSPTAMQIMVMEEDKFDPDLLWLATYGAGLECFNKRTGTFTHYPHDPANADSTGHNNLMSLLRDRQGILWLQTLGGGLDRFDPRTKSFTHFLHDPARATSIGSDSLVAAFEDSAGRLWIGTTTGLELLDRDTGAFVHFSQTVGMRATMARVIAEDGAGRLWIGSGSGDGLIRLDPVSQTVKTFLEGDGLPSASFGRSGVRDADGHMWIGSTNGLVRFDPEEVGMNRYVPPVKITALKQAQDPIALGRAPERADAISLDWKHNFFEFEYAALSYTNSANNRYRYMLQGIDRDWYDAGGRRFGRYSGLRGGTYTLRIIASNNDGVWNTEGVSLRVRVGAPWWDAWWFSASVVAVVAAVVFLVFRYRSRQLHAERAAAEQLRRSEERYRALSAELERRVQERTEALASANRDMESFSYSVSHDLRNPLHVIDGYTVMLREEYASVLPPEATRCLEVIRSSVSHMGELIEGLLSLSRVGRQTLRRNRVEATKLVHDALSFLEDARKGRNVEISVGELPACEGDEVLLRQVWVNLVSNALKFTRPMNPARIEIGCNVADGERAYYIRDNGVGMDLSYKDKLFKAFQRLHSEAEFEGTGVGLALVHQIVRRHGGRVWVDSRIGEGTTVSFTLGGTEQVSTASVQSGSTASTGM